MLNDYDHFSEAYTILPGPFLVYAIVEVPATFFLHILNKMIFNLNLFSPLNFNFIYGVDKSKEDELSSFFLSAALQSVFPQTELGTFMSLVKRDKERQLVELTQIVTGIRLFNKECGKGGEGIDDCKLTIS